MRVIRILLAVGSALLCIVPTAAARSTSDANLATTHYRRANQLYVQGKYTASVIEYKKALAYKPDAWQLHRNISLAYHKMGDYSQALHHVTRFLTLKPYTKDKARFTVLRDECLARLYGTAKLTVSIDGAQVFLDGKLIGTSPIKPLRLRAGTYRLKIVHEGFKIAERSLMVTLGPAVAMYIELTKVEPIVVKPIKRHRKRKTDLAYVFAWVTAGTGAAFLGTGIAMTLLSRKDEDAVLNAKRENNIVTGLTQASAKNKENSARTKRVVAFVMYGLAAASIGTSIALFVVSAKRRSQERVDSVQWHFAPAPIPGGAVFTFDGTF